MLFCLIVFLVVSQLVSVFVQAGARAGGGWAVCKSARNGMGGLQCVS